MQNIMFMSSPSANSPTDINYNNIRSQQYATIECGEIVYIVIHDVFKRIEWEFETSYMYRKNVLYYKFINNTECDITVCPDDSLAKILHPSIISNSFWNMWNIWNNYNVNARI